MLEADHIQAGAPGGAFRGAIAANCDTDRSASAVEEKAAKLLVQLDGNGTPEEWARLDAWLAASPRHRAAFLRLSVAWSRSDNLRRLRPLDDEADPDLLSPLPRAAKTRTGCDSDDIANWLVLATSVIGALLWSGLIFDHVSRAFLGEPECVTSQAARDGSACRERCCVARAAAEE